MAFVCAFLLCACDVSGMGSLPDLSKPYTGVYECEVLTLGGEDAKEKFDFIRLELKGGGTFSLAYRTSEGKEGEVGGEYAMDVGEGTLTLSKKTPVRTFSHCCKVENGVIYFDRNFNGELLHAEFRMP